MSASLFSTFTKQRRKTGSSTEDQAWGSPDPGPKDLHCYTSSLSLPPRADRSGRWQHTRTPPEPARAAVHPTPGAAAPIAIVAGGRVSAASAGKWLFLPPRLSHHQHQFFPLQQRDMLELVTTHQWPRHSTPQTWPAGRWVSDDLLFGGFLPHPSPRLPLPRAAISGAATISGAAPHAAKRGGEDLAREDLPRPVPAGSGAGPGWRPSSPRPWPPRRPSWGKLTPAAADPRPEASGDLWPVQETRDDTFTTAPEVELDAEPSSGFRCASRKRASRCSGRRGFAFFLVYGRRARWLKGVCLVSVLGTVASTR